jgi:hypothetical protein
MAGILHTIQEKITCILSDYGSRQRLLQNVRKKLSPEGEIAIDTPLTLTELRDAVLKGKSNKAPSGHDFFFNLFAFGFKWLTVNLRVRHSFR